MSDEKRKQIEALRGKSIDYILNEAFRITGHPIAAFDTSYNIIAHVKGVVTDDRFWNELTTYGCFSHESVNFFLNEGFIKAFAESETVAEMNSDKLKYNRMNGKLFDKDNVQLGNIIVIACLKPFEDGDKELIELICAIMSDALRRSDHYHKIDKVYQNALIDKLLDGKPTGGRRMKAGITALYENLKKNLYLGAVDISKYEDTVTHLAYFRDMFRKIQGEHKYFVHLNCVVAIISTDSPVLNVKKDLSGLNGFFEENDIYAGISGKFQSFNKLKQAYREAIYALNYGLKSMRDKHIFMFDNYRAEYFLDNKNYYRQDVNQYVATIDEYDAENKTALLRSLYMYLLYGMNAEAASRAAGLTPARLSRDLNMLEEMLGIDWNDGDMLTSMFITIKMLDKAF